MDWIGSVLRALSVYGMHSNDQHIDKARQDRTDTVHTSHAAGTWNQEREQQQALVDYTKGSPLAN
jgi:hypothetical protein